jgi:hypothetical protein
MNIQALEQALQAIEKAWELDCITSEVLPAIQTIRQEITKLKQEQNELSE